MIPRHLVKPLRQAARQFLILTIIVPHQSGKTTLARSLFSHSSQDLLHRSERGAIFECFIISEWVKFFASRRISEAFPLERLPRSRNGCSHRMESP